MKKLEKYKITGEIQKIREIQKDGIDTFFLDFSNLLYYINFNYQIWQDLPEITYLENLEYFLYMYITIAPLVIFNTIKNFSHVVTMDRKRLSLDGNHC